MNAKKPIVKSLDRIPCTRAGPTVGAGTHRPSLATYLLNILCNFLCSQIDQILFFRFSDFSSTTDWRVNITLEFFKLISRSYKIENRENRADWLPLNFFLPYSFILPL